MLMLTVDDFESHAEKILSKSVLGFYKTGSYDDRTIQWNREAFQRSLLKPTDCIIHDITCMHTNKSMPCVPDIGCDPEC